MKTLKEKIAIMQAAEDGMKIERLYCLRRDEGWCKVSVAVVLWDWIHYDYRIKKEPLVVYINIYSPGVIATHETFESADMARKNPDGSYAPYSRTAKCVEVLKDDENRSKNL